MRLSRLAMAMALAALSRPSHAQCPDGSEGSACRAARRSVPIDTQAVVVLPFAVRGPDETTYLADGMKDLFQMALDGLGGYRLKHPSNSQRQLQSASKPADFGETAAIVRALGARFSLGGSVVIVGRNARVNAELYDAVLGRRIVPLAAQGPVDRLDAIVDSLTVALVARGPLKSTAAATRSGEFVTKYPGALRAYLSGEQLVRSGVWRAAADSFQSSIRQDSSFGWAYLSLRRIIANSKAPAVRGLEEAIVAHQEKFPDRIRRIFALHWRADRIHALETVDRLAAQYPYDPEVAYMQADVYFHVGRELGLSQEEVRVHFVRAIELDGDRPETLDHYTSVLAESGDTAGAFDALGRARLAAPDDGLLRAFEMGLKVAFRRADPVVLQNESPNGNADYVTPRLLPRDPALGLALADSFAKALTSTWDYSPGAMTQGQATILLRRYHYALGQGRYRAAWAILDTVMARLPNTGARPRLLLHAIVTGNHLGEAAEVYKFLAQRARSDSAGNVDAVSVTAWYAAVLGPIDSAELTIASLDRFRSQFAAANTIAPAIATGLRGMLALRRGDTVTARQLLSKAYETHTRLPNLQSLLFPSIPFALTLATLELAAGDLKAAEKHVHDAYPPHEAVSIVPFAEELRGRIYEALGDMRAAREAYGNVVKLLANADPELFPMRQSAQAALQRLSSRP